MRNTRSEVGNLGVNGVRQPWLTESQETPRYGLETILHIVQTKKPAITEGTPKGQQGLEAT